MATHEFENGVTLIIDDGLELVNVTSICDKRPHVLVFKVEKPDAALSSLLEEIRSFADRCLSRLQSEAPRSTAPGSLAASIDTTTLHESPRTRADLRGPEYKESQAPLCRPELGGLDVQSVAPVRSRVE